MSDKVEIRFYIPRRLYNIIYLLTLDPMFLKPRYGLVSKIGTKLLEDWVKRVQKSGEVA